MAHIRCLEMLDAMLLRRLDRPATSLLLVLVVLLLDEEDDAGESTDRAVRAEVPSSSSSSSSTAARFLPRPLVCLDAAAVAFFRVDIAENLKTGRYYSFEAVCTVCLLFLP